MAVTPVSVEFSGSVKYGSASGFSDAAWAARVALPVPVDPPAPAAAAAAAVALPGLRT